MNPTLPRQPLYRSQDGGENPQARVTISADAAGPMGDLFGLTRPMCTNSVYSQRCKCWDKQEDREARGRTGEKGVQLWPSSQAAQTQAFTEVILPPLGEKLSAWFKKTFQR